MAWRVVLHELKPRRSRLCGQMRGSRQALTVLLQKAAPCSQLISNRDLLCGNRVACGEVQGLERLVAGFKSSHAALKGYVRQIEDTGHAKDGVILAAGAKIALYEGRLQIGEELQTLQGEEVRQRKALSRAKATARKFDHD